MNPLLAIDGKIKLVGEYIETIGSCLTFSKKVTPFFFGKKFLVVKDVSKAELKDKVARMYEVNDLNAIFVFKFITHFGGGKSSGFGLIYDSVESEPTYRLISWDQCTIIYEAMAKEEDELLKIRE